MAKTCYTVTVIIVNWNRGSLLIRALSSLKRSTFKDFEIIVVDNASQDNSIKLVKETFPDVRIVALDKNVGFSAANNIGLSHAQGKYIALLNNDAEVAPSWLAELVKALETHKNTGFCASKILLYDKPHLIDACGDTYSWDGLGDKRGHLEPAFLYDKFEEVFGACAAAAIYRRELLEDLGGFDEEFFLAHEDTDLSFRAQLRGYRCLYVPTAVVYHRLSASIGADSPTYIYYGHRNAELVYFKNMPGLLLWLSLPAHLLLDIALFLFYLRRGQARPYLRAKLDALKSLPRILRKRREIQRNRKVSVAYIASLLDESWLKKALRKKIKKRGKHVVQIVRNWGRRILPCGLKHLLRRFFLRAPPRQSRFFLPPDDPEGAVNIWIKSDRFKKSLEAVAKADLRRPRVSIIMLTHNKLPLTHLCMESLYLHTSYPNFEVIIVDNASQDGTQAYLASLSQILPNLRVILNEQNKGFAGANNQGIMHSCGDYIVLLNNDVIVTPGWLTRLIGYLERDPYVGMVGPVTNSAGNEQMIRADYTNLEELEAFAKRRAREYAGRYFQIPMLGMFCVVFRRKLLDEVGLLDERFGLGTFEDDDFCHRVKLKGYKLICAEDVFIHHFGKATMSKLGDKGYLKLFEHNRRLFEKKWGVKWRPHRTRV